MNIFNFKISGDQILTKSDKDQNHNGMIFSFLSKTSTISQTYSPLVPWKILLFPSLSFSPILSKIPPIFSPSISHDRLLICYCLSLDKMLISPSLLSLHLLYYFPFSPSFPLSLSIILSARWYLLVSIMPEPCNY